MKIAVYPGSFDPITEGHIDIIRRSLALFDKVYVVVANNYAKKYLFSEDERIKLVKESLKGMKNVEVVKGEGLLVRQAEALHANAIVRGLRVVSDYEYEVEVAEVYRYLAPEIEILFLFAKKEFAFVSSSRIKEIYSLGGDISNLVTDPVMKAMDEKKKKHAEISGK
jgi:pantetheine-phosphate adenylyltransferase